MALDYKLAKQLKEAGFKQQFATYQVSDAQRGIDPVWYPDLSELIDACGFCFGTLVKEMKDRTPEHYVKFSGWKATATDAEDYWEGKGKTPEEAVAELWLILKNKGQLG